MLIVLDESDKSIVLYLNDYIDNLRILALQKTDVIALCKKCCIFWRKYMMILYQPILMIQMRYYV